MSDVFVVSVRRTSHVSVYVRINITWCLIMSLGCSGWYGSGKLVLFAPEKDVCTTADSATVSSLGVQWTFHPHKLSYLSMVLSIGSIVVGVTGGWRFDFCM